MKHTVSIAAILLLSACAQLPQDSAGLWQSSEHISSFAAEGRLAVKAEGKGSYANFDWTYQPPVETINLHIWADGRRVARAPYRILPDGMLEQYGWIISRTVNSEGKARILQLDNGKLNIRLVFTEIGMPSETETPERCAARTR